MNKVNLSVTDLDTLKTMADFYLRVNLSESAYRTVKVILSFYPNDIWANGMLARCYDHMKKYSEVLDLTENISFYDSMPKIKNAMMMLRARALMKTGQTQKSKDLVQKIITEKNSDKQ